MTHVFCHTKTTNQAMSASNSWIVGLQSKSPIDWQKKRRRHSIEKSRGNHGFSNPMFKHIYFNGLYKGFPGFSGMFSVIFQFYKIVNICPRLFSASPSGFPSEGDVFCTHRRKVQFINSPWPGNSQQHHLEEHDLPRFCSTQMWYSIQRTYASMHGLSWLL